MFDAPGSVRAINPAIKYNNLVLDMLDGLLTPQEVESLKAEIKNDTKLTTDQIDMFLSQFPVEQSPEQQAVKAADWQGNFMQWYKDNLIVISLIQWVFIIILLIRKSN